MFQDISESCAVPKLQLPRFIDNPLHVVPAHAGTHTPCCCVWRRCWDVSLL